jgi:protein-tyrosine-phosphatase
MWPRGRRYARTVASITPFARPVTDEVLQAADVIVTMGHAAGVIDIPQHVRHEDWRVGDPIGAPISEMRRISADIETRVRALLAELGAPDHDRKPAIAP